MAERHGYLRPGHVLNMRSARVAEGTPAEVPARIRPVGGRPITLGRHRSEACAGGATLCPARESLRTEPSRHACRSGREAYSDDRRFRCKPRYKNAASNHSTSAPSTAPRCMATNPRFAARKRVFGIWNPDSWNALLTQPRVCRALRPCSQARHPAGDRVAIFAGYNTPEWFYADLWRPDDRPSPRHLSDQSLGRFALQSRPTLRLTPFVQHGRSGADPKGTDAWANHDCLPAAGGPAVSST